MRSIHRQPQHSGQDIEFLRFWLGSGSAEYQGHALNIRVTQILFFGGVSVKSWNFCFLSFSSWDLWSVIWQVLFLSFFTTIRLLARTAKYGSYLLFHVLQFLLSKTTNYPTTNHLIWCYYYHYYYYYQWWAPISLLLERAFGNRNKRDFKEYMLVIKNSMWM